MRIGDGGGGDGIEDGPAGSAEQDADGGGDGAEASGGVAHDVLPGAFEVEAGVAIAVQEEQAADVGEEADDGDREHQAGADGGGFGETFPGFVQDAAGDEEQQGAVEEGGEGFGAALAEGALIGGGAEAAAEGPPGGAEGGGVGQHVAGVGHEGQRAAEPAADELDDHQGGGQREGGGDAAGDGARVAAVMPRGHGRERAHACSGL